MTDQRDHVEGTMAHDTDKILTRRASLAVVGGLALLPLVGAVQAAEQPTAQEILKNLQELTSEQEMLKAFQERTVRGGATELRRIKEDEQEYIEALRHRQSRSFTEEDRIKVAEIARYKPNIDLEINFDFDSAVINPKARPVAVELGRALVNPKLKGIVCLVGGHTDGKGSPTYNLDLSRRRAEAIKAFLVEFYGVPAENLIAAGFGMERLKNPGDPFADENRRVQVVNMLKPE
jgi:outer membrane protein OmpA-like peptidoglycan-associated protein